MEDMVAAVILNSAIVIDSEQVQEIKLTKWLIMMEKVKEEINLDAIDALESEQVVGNAYVIPP